MRTRSALPPSPVQATRGKGRAQAQFFQWRTGTGGLCTECVLASRYLRNTRGGSANPPAMIRGGSVHPRCSAADSSEDRGDSVGVGRHGLEASGAAAVTGRTKGDRVISMSARGDAANGATGARGEAAFERGVPQPAFHVTLNSIALEQAFCSF